MGERIYSSFSLGRAKDRGRVWDLGRIAWTRLLRGGKSNPTPDDHDHELHAVFEGRDRGRVFVFVSLFVLGGEGVYCLWHVVFLEMSLSRGWGAWGWGGGRRGKLGGGDSHFLDERVTKKKKAEKRGVGKWKQVRIPDTRCGCLGAARRKKGNGRAYGRTDTPSYRDAWPRLKNTNFVTIFMLSSSWKNGFLCKSAFWVTAGVFTALYKHGLYLHPDYII